MLCRALLSTPSTLSPQPLHPPPSPHPAGYRNHRRGNNPSNGLGLPHTPFCHPFTTIFCVKNSFYSQFMSKSIIYIHFTNTIYLADHVISRFIVVISRLHINSMMLHLFSGIRMLSLSVHSLYKNRGFTCIIFFVKIKMILSVFHKRFCSRFVLLDV